MHNVTLMYFYNFASGTLLRWQKHLIHQSHTFCRRSQFVCILENVITIIREYCFISFKSSRMSTKILFLLNLMIIHNL